MTDLLEIINEVVQYGLQSNVDIENREKHLEEYLVRLYSEYFKINYEYDDRDYPNFDKDAFPIVIENVRKNFPDFGLYHEILNSHELQNEPELAMGDAVDDLSDIIYDILEVKWRLENNSEPNGLWYFELIFYGHTQQHVLSLLNFMKSKNG